MSVKKIYQLPFFECSKSFLIKNNGYQQTIRLQITYTKKTNKLGVK